MIYQTLRNILFRFEPETAHKIALKSLQSLYQLGLLSLQKKELLSPRQVMGITFPNPVGLAAGLDKNCEYIDPLSTLGFGFIEIGTLTLTPQSGNPKPRLFRLPEQQALINRMGFPNQGMDYGLQQLQKAHYKGILGINIGKSFSTPIEQATPDYIACLRKAYPYASYITINISSPNTPGLRNLQYGDHLHHLLSAIKQEQTKLANEYKKYIPIAIKIAPDMTFAELQQATECILSHNLDSIIATNTSVSREGIEHLSLAKEQGGLSGKPLFAKSLTIVQQLVKLVHGKIPIIACGGIMNANNAQAMLNAGASLVQIYTGFIYQGPKLIHEIIEKCKL